MPRAHRSRSCGDGSAEGIPGQCPVSEVRMSSGRPCRLPGPAAPLVMPGLVPGIPISQTGGTPSKHVDGRDKPGHDVSEGTSSTHTNFSIWTPGAVPLNAPDHGALHGARSFRQDCDMRRSWFRARICASCPRARGRSFCRARIRVSRSRAHDAIWRARDLSGAGDPGVQDSIFRAHDPSGVRDLSHGIPLIPLNPT